jgi:hypothetical protein
MIQAPNYSGERAGIGMVRGGGEKATQSLQELNETILEADKFKYTERKKEESAFLEAIKTKPEFVISAKAREEQAKAIEDFNLKWFQASRRGLSTMDKAQMANDRAALEAMQDQQTAQYKQYLQVKEAVMRDPYKFDEDEFMEWESDYQQTGQFDHSSLPIKAQSFDSALDIYGNKVRSKPTQVTRAETIGGVKQQITTEASGTKEEAQAKIANMLMYNEAWRKDVVKQFQALPMDTKIQYLDTDRSGTISPEEAKEATGYSNPIIRWAQETKWQKALDWNESTPKGVPGTKVTSNLPNLEAFGKTSKYAPTEAIKTISGQTTYNTYHSFNNIPVSDIPMGTPIRILDPKEEKTIKPDTTVTADVTGYDEEKDEFTFIVKANFQGLYGYVSSLERGKDWRIAVKRKDLPTEFSSLEILKGGKRIKIGDLRAKEGVNTATPVKTDKGNPFKPR